MGHEARLAAGAARGQRRSIPDSFLRRFPFHARTRAARCLFLSVLTRFGPWKRSCNARIVGLAAPHPVRSLSHDGAAVSSVRRAKIERLLSARACDVSALRDASWAGLPEELRPEAWRVLLGYAPPSEERRAPALQVRARSAVMRW